jgi:hypothetical protein
VDLNGTSDEKPFGPNIELQRASVHDTLRQICCASFLHHVFGRVLRVLMADGSNNNYGEDGTKNILLSLSSFYILPWCYQVKLVVGIHTFSL